MNHAEALAAAWPNGIAAHTLRRIEDAIKIGTSLRYYFFRGQSRVFEWLLPIVHRAPFSQTPRENIEFRAAQRFRLRARSFAPKVPEWGDHLSWLLMMQHYGVPTRLLDWTTSILVALYFAVAEPNAEPGEVWCMHPSVLNWHSNRQICGPDDPPIKYLAAEVFLEPKQLPGLAEPLNVKSPPTLPLALIPAFEFPRMAAQMSRFTIHPSGDGASMIEFLLRTEQYLVRYRVPAEYKLGLKRDLASLGISHDTLYQRLGSLARTIREEILEEDFELIDPPQFEAKSEPPPNG
jgi:hypothetical protein